MSALSMSSFGFRAGNAASFSTVQQGQSQRGGFAQQSQRGGFAQQSQRGGFQSTQGLQGMQAQRGANVQQGQRTATFNSTFNSGAAQRGGSASASCPTCNSSYCPDCNRAGGSQSSITGAGFSAGAARGGQGGQFCAGCAYQSR